MAELIECVNNVTYEADSVSNEATYSLRSIFPGKKDPAFRGNLITGVVRVESSKDLEGKKGSLLISTKDAEIYTKSASKFKSFANKDVGDLVCRYENIVATLGSDRSKYDILFRPAGTILDESSEWIFYRLAVGKHDKAIPVGDWDIDYVLCCGGDEKLIQGAPTTFAVFSRKVSEDKI